MNWTIHKAAIEWGVDRRSLAKWISELGLSPKRGATFHTRDISRAIHGDLEFERTRLTRADADLREMERAQLRGDLVALSEVAALVNPVLLSARQRLNAMPSECATRVNPSDPVHAQQQLQAWVDASLPQIREALPRPNGKRAEKK